VQIASATSAIEIVLELFLLVRTDCCIRFTSSYTHVAYVCLRIEMLNQSEPRFARRWSISFRRQLAVFIQTAPTPPNKANGFSPMISAGPCRFSEIGALANGRTEPYSSVTFNTTRVASKKQRADRTERVEIMRPAKRTEAASKRQPADCTGGPEVR